MYPGTVCVPGNSTLSSDFGSSSFLLGGTPSYVSGDEETRRVFSKRLSTTKPTAFEALNSVCIGLPVLQLKIRDNLIYLGTLVYTS
jgi:hypothetical protein